MIPLEITDDLFEENQRLRLRLEEAEAVVNAIRNGLVDAVVVQDAPDDGVYTLEGADRPYRLLVEAMQQGVAVLNSQGVILYCNPCLADLFNMSVEKVIGGNVDGLVSGADQAVWTDLLQNTEHAPVKTEVSLRRQDGTMFPAAIALNQLSSRKFSLLITDLSKQKQYEELLASRVLLRHTEIRYRRLFETAKDGIFILDANTLQITDANPFMTELLGYTYDEFLGKELWEIGLFRDKQASQAAYQELQEKGYLRYDHLPLETKHGETAEVEFVSNIYQADGRTVAQCNIRDISERSRLERRLKEQTEALADLHRRKDEFLAMLSHELRSPLAPISNAVHLLRLRKHEDPVQQRARLIIERQLSQLTRLVDDLMEVSRITTGRIHLQQERVEVKGIVENGIETARTLIGQRRHELTVSFPPQPIWLHADASRLEQVVVNLLTNAAKYTEEGGRIWLTVRQENGECVLEVRDTGVGIAPELVPRIFDLFTQAERSLDRSQGGLGIGLALVQRLAEMHGGTVAVTSIFGQGSEFVVRLPLITAPEPLPSLAEELKPNGPSLRVMVVDDSVDTAETVAMLLNLWGHEVRMVHDGPSTLQSALDYRPDIVLLDIGLPGLDGFEVAKRLRRQPELDGVMLVAMTGYGQESDRQRSQDSGFNHHLVKPASFEKLQQILATVPVKAT